MAGSTELIRILIADDHPMIRAGLRHTLERREDMKVVAEADDGLAAIALFREHRPDLTLMDLQMPILDGYGAIAGIRAEYPEAIIVALTTYGGDARVARALTAGASAYLLKTSPSEDIVVAVRCILSGDKVLDDTVTQKLAVDAGQPTLTPREVSVLQLVATGKSNVDIALNLGVSEATVKACAKTLFLKLRANDRTHAVTLARQRGFLD